MFLNRVWRGMTEVLGRRPRQGGGPEVSGDVGGAGRVKGLHIDDGEGPGTVKVLKYYVRNLT